MQSCRVFHDRVFLFVFTELSVKRYCGTQYNELLKYNPFLKFLCGLPCAFFSYMGKTAQILQ